MFKHAPATLPTTTIPPTPGTTESTVIMVAEAKDSVMTLTEVQTNAGAGAERGAEPDAILCVTRASMRPVLC